MPKLAGHALSSLAADDAAALRDGRGRQDQLMKAKAPRSADPYTWLAGEKKGLSPFLLSLRVIPPPPSNY